MSTEPLLTGHLILAARAMDTAGVDPHASEEAIQAAALVMRDQLHRTDPIESDTEAAAAYYEEQVRQVRAYCLDTIEWTMAAVPVEKVDEDDPRVPALSSNAGKYFMAKRLLQLLDEEH